MHILRARADALDWKRLRSRFGERWPLLYTYLVLFTFVYPSLVAAIPSSLMDELARLHADLRSAPPADAVCQGTFVSRAQYLIDIGQYGMSDARLAPRGACRRKT